MDFFTYLYHIRVRDVPPLLTPLYYENPKDYKTGVDGNRTHH